MVASCTGCRFAATDTSTTRSTWSPSSRSASARTEGRAYFDRKVAEGKTKREALRALKRQVSNAVFRQMVADASE